MKKLLLMVLFPIVVFAQTSKTVSPTYVKQVVRDTATTLRAAIATKLNASDTLSLSNRINQKLNASDTLSLSNRINQKASLTITDSLAEDIAIKLNISDSTIYATQYDLTQIEGGGLSESAVKALISDSVAGKLDKNFQTNFTETTIPDGQDWAIIQIDEDTELRSVRLNNLPVSSATSAALGTVTTKNESQDILLQQILTAIHEIQDTLLLYGARITALENYSGQPLPIAPQSFLAAASTTAKRIVLTWNLVGTIDSVVIERRNGGSWARLTGLGSVETYNDDAINYDTQYWYRAKAYFNDVASNYSDSSGTTVVTPTYLLTYSTFDFGTIDSVESTSGGSGVEYTTIWSAESQVGNSSWTDGTYPPINNRMIISGSYITGSADTIRLVFRPHSTTADSFRNVTIGVRSSSSTFASTPSIVYFSGNSGTGSQVGNDFYSDPLAFNMGPGTDYLVHRYQYGGNRYTRTLTSGTQSYASSTTTNLSNDLTFSTTGDGRICGLVAIQSVNTLSGSATNSDTTKVFYLTNNSGVSISVDTLYLNNANFSIDYTKGTINNGASFPVYVTLDRDKSAGAYTSTMRVYHSGTTSYQTVTITAIIVGSGGGSTIPNPPTNFWAVGGDFRVDGGFTAPVGQWDSVVVYNSGSRITKVDSGTTTFALTSLPHNTSYTLNGRAVNNGEYSVFSNSVTVRTTDTTSAPVKVLNYYVDASNGNDNNSGTSPTSAWRTLSRVNNFNFNTTNGNVYIGLKRGEVWRETFNPSDAGTGENNRLILTCYGSGDLPRISGGTDYLGSTSTWTQYSTNVWYRTGAAATGTTSFYIFQKADNNTVYWGRNESSIANVNADYDFIYTGGNLYVYATTNPAIYFQRLERTGARVPVYFSSSNDGNGGANYWTLDSLEIYAGGETNIRPENADYLKVQYCNIHHTGNPQTNEGDNLYWLSSYGTIYKNRIYEPASHNMYIGAYHGYRSTNTTIDGNYIANSYYTAVDIQVSLGNASSIDSKDMVIRNNWIIADSLPQSTYFSSGAGIQVLGMCETGTIQKTTIYNNVVMGFDYAINWHRSADTIEVYNNTFANNDAYYMWETTDDEGWCGGPYTGPNWLFMRNNIFYSNTGGYMIDMVNDTNKVCSNNLYITSRTSPFSIDTQDRNYNTVTNFTGWNAWLNDNGSHPDGDVNSQLSSSTSNIFTTFTSVSATKDLTPYPGGTLATFTGYDLSAIFNTDFKGNVRTGTWRIGAILP